MAEFEVGGAYRCSSCGKEINSLIEKFFTKDNNIFCEKCFKKLTVVNNRNSKAEEEKRVELEKMKLYTEIRRLFDISEIPERIIFECDKLVRDEGYKYGGIGLTLRYLKYCKEGFNLSLDYGVLYVIRVYYKEAERYYREQQAIFNNNLSFKPTNSQQTVVIKKSNNQRFIPKSRMEDI